MSFALRVRQLLLVYCFLLFPFSAVAQLPIRPDAFPDVEVPMGESKAILMASDSASMADWRHYPTYDYYVTMMQHYEQCYPSLCRLDTIGTSVNGRLILCLLMTGTEENGCNKPQFFYSATIHGDELVGFHMMLHLIDTMLRAYGTSPQITQLLNTTEVYVNPLANPDGTYYGNGLWGGDNTVAFSRRNNANNVDLNRNFPDPFASSAKSVEPENEAMIEYVSHHQFRLSANLHSGSEVLNYPWDSFSSIQRSHPYADWWTEVSRRFVDTCRQVSPLMFTSVIGSGYIAGGDWYTISGGRQDYMNEEQGVLEMTMELSNNKKVASDDLPFFWNALRQALINYIGEVHALPGYESGLTPIAPTTWRVYPNPTRGVVTVETDCRKVLLNLSNRAAGVYSFFIDGRWFRVVKY